MKPKTLILMLVAVSCGLVASFMTSRYLAAQQQAPVEDEKVAVLIAKKKLPGYSRLNDPEAFEVKQYEKSNVTKDVVGDFEKVKGRTLKNPLSEGKPLAESDLLDPSATPLTSKLQPGEIAMAVKVTQDTSTGFILPSDRVDVQATQTRSGNNEKPFSKFILQNIEVLAVGQDITLPDGTVYKEANKVMLRLKHKEAELLAVYADTGNLRLVLRRPDDTTLVDTTGESISPNKGSFVSDGASADDPKNRESGFTAPNVPAGATDVPGEAPKAPKTSLKIVNGPVVKIYEHPEEHKDAAKPAGPAAQK